MAGRSIVLSFIFLAVAVSSYPRAEAPPNAATDVLLYTVTKQYKPLAWMGGADRFSPDAAILIQDAGGRRPLVPEFATSADPAVSFDGKNLLFAGKAKSQDTWQIWEVSLSGGDPRRVTACEEDCIRPFYLPDDRIVYAKRNGGKFVVETAGLAGGGAVQLTYVPGSALPTDGLRDGRILFEATYPLGNKGIAELYTVYSDGSGVESYRCDHGKVRYAGKEVASGDIVFSSGYGLGRFTSALAHQVPIAAPQGEYAGDVAELASGDRLLAWRPDAKGHFQIKRWTPASGSWASAIEEKGTNAVEPALISERIEPKRHPSGLHDWPNANLLCLNAYTSKYRFAEGAIRAVQLYTREVTGNAKLLGSAPVERDGSFFVQVPTEQPLQIELLDGAGKTLKREEGWFWMRRGEQRVCVGCHAGPEMAPENAVPLTLLRSTKPAAVTGANQGATGGN